MESDHDHQHPPSAPSETTNQSKPSDQESEQIAETDDQECSSNKKSTSTIRSYECSFCKKGFTNAQALGGHMNIHRKDRNRRKKPPGGETSQKLLQIPHMFTTASSSSNNNNNNVYFSSSTKGTGTSTDPNPQELASGVLKRTVTWPSFASSQGMKFTRGEGDLLNKISSDQDDTEVDLELRLGFKSSSTANNIKTRSFF